MRSQGATLTTMKPMKGLTPLVRPEARGVGLRTLHPIALWVVVASTATTIAPARRFAPRDLIFRPDFVHYEGPFEKFFIIFQIS